MGRFRFNGVFTANRHISGRVELPEGVAGCGRDFVTFILRQVGECATSSLRHFDIAGSGRVDQVDYYRPANRWQWIFERLADSK
jgi:hypothetical protein